jgi:hypothetical protein
MNRTQPSFLVQPSARRGVLLLVVLSMLTLFLMLGAAYVVMASRSRDIARAFSRLSVDSGEAKVDHAHFLDAALLTTLRGGPTVQLSGAALKARLPTSADYRFEPLLADRYGASQTINAQATVTGTTLPLYTATLVSPSLPHPALLNGRILTFTNPAADSTSHRILRATLISSTTYQLTIGPPHDRLSFKAPPANSSAIINGLEFSGTAPDNEEYDGFDMAANPFLAHLSISDIPSEWTCNKMSFIRPLDFSVPAEAQIAEETDPATLLPYAADNDNDGEPDGVFLDFGFPTVTNASGQTVQLDASVLIVDLDSRINVNAHGSLAPRLYQSGTAVHNGWTSGTFSDRSLGLNQYVPLGIGSGPAEIAADRLPFPRTYNRVAIEDPWLFTMLGGGTGCQVGVRPYGSRFSEGAPTLRVPRISGRLAETSPSGTGAWAAISGSTTTLAGFPFGRGGVSGINDAASASNDQLVAYTSSTVAPSLRYGVPDVWWSGTSNDQPNAFVRRIYNSPPDLHGRMKALTEAPPAGAAVPTLSLAKPEWGSETIDDPYDVRLGENARRSGAPTGTAAPADAPYTYAELERLLRPYDIDSQSLPFRLAAALGSVAEESRLLFTTDSWDTTVITGTAAQRIRQWMNTLTTASNVLYATGTAPLSPVSGIISGELARGEKFDLSRSLTYEKPTVSGTAVPWATGTSVYRASSPYYLQRQAYFKDLYTLLCALTGTSAPSPNQRKLAQWAANVVEFIDADSTMTPFEYDRNPHNGWTVDGNFESTGDTDREVVFGAERPEVVITEALAWEHTDPGKSGLLVALHRPWNSRALARTTSGSAYETSAEPCDPALAVGTSGTSNILDLGKRDASASGGYPIWRLRVERGGRSAIIRFDVEADAKNGPGTEYRALTTATASPVLPPNTTVVVSGSASYYDGITTSWKPISLATGTSIVTGTTGSALLLPAGGTGDVTIHVERLSDPTAEASDDAWKANPAITAKAMATGASGEIRAAMYRIVDSVTIQVAPTTAGVAPPNHIRELNGADSAFWRNDFKPRPTTSFGSAVADLTTSSAAWFCWPNRPLLSPVELLLVRKGDAATWLADEDDADPDAKDYARISSGSNALTDLGAGLATPDPEFHRRVLSAVHVPTRFAGIHTTVPANGWGSTQQELTGIYPTVRGVNQLSSYREPGRVNINTIVGFYDLANPSKTESDVWNAVVGGSLTSPTMSYDSATLSGKPGRPRRKTPSRLIPEQKALDIPAVPARPKASGTQAPKPTRAGDSSPYVTTSDLMLSLSGTDTFITTVKSGTDTHTSVNTRMLQAIARNPIHGMYTAARLGNTATVRSNVFGVWVTLREATAGDPSTAKLHRAFYIIDRSIPVGYEPGKDHNVRDTIRLRRIIE